MENKMIRKANHLIEASYKLSAIEQKVIAILASSIKAEDKDFQSYPVRIKEFQQFTGVSSNNYDQLEEVVLGLKEKNLKIIYPDEDGKKVTLNVSWLSSTKYTEGSGIIELCFDPSLKPFFLQLKARFTNYRLKNVIQLKSQFSIRIYELLKQYERLGQRLFTLTELRSILGIDEGQYKLYADFKRKVILVAQEELANKTDISFKFEEIKIGHGVGQIRFFIKSKTREKAQIAEAEMVVPVLQEEKPKSEEFDQLIALLPKDYREKESVCKLLKTWLEKQNFDYVARNIEYANKGSNAVNPWANLGKGSNYRVYLAKALAGDFGLPHREDNEAKKKAEIEAKHKAQEKAAAEKQRQEQVQSEKENHERARVFQQSLPPEALEHLRAEALSRLDPQQQEIVKRKGPGAELMLKIMMDKISLERMKIS